MGHVSIHRRLWSRLRHADCRPFSCYTNLLQSLTHQSLQPIIAIQNALSESPAQATLGISLAIFAQTFFGGLFLNLAALVFSSGLSDGIKKYAPSVHVDKVVVAGATGFREVVAKNEVQGVVKAYSLGVDHVFYLAVGAAAIMFVLSLGMGWHPISKKEGAANPAGTAAPGGEENIA